MLLDIFCNLFMGVDSTTITICVQNQINVCFSLAKLNLNFGKFGVKFVGVTSWNELPTDISTLVPHIQFLKTNVVIY